MRAALFTTSTFSLAAALVVFCAQLFVNTRPAQAQTTYAYNCYSNCPGCGRSVAPCPGAGNCVDICECNLFECQNK